MSQLKKLFRLVVPGYIGLLLTACGGGGGSSDAAAVPVTSGQASEVSSHLAATWTSDPVYKSIAAYDADEEATVLVATDANGNLLSVDGVVWNGSTGEAAVIYFNPEGLPESMVSEGNVYLFENYSGTTVDIARITADGQYTLLTAQPSTSTASLNVAALQATVLEWQSAAMTVDTSIDLRGVLRIAALALKVVEEALGDSASLPGSSLADSLLVLQAADNAELEETASRFGSTVCNSDTESCIVEVVNRARNAAELADGVLLARADTIRTARLNLEPGESCEEAYPVGDGGGEFSGVILPEDDVDFFGITIQDAGSLKVGASGEAGPMLTFFDATCSPMADRDFAAYEQVAPQEIFVKVAGASSGNYILSISLLTEVTVNQNEVVLTLTDNGMAEDGDIIDLRLNEVAVVTNHKLLAAGTQFPVILQDGLNTLSILAKSEGYAPPNTALLEISGVIDGRMEQSWKLNEGDEVTLDINVQ